MLRVMLAFGTRPEAVKMAPLVRALIARRDMECIVCVTAQHREMLDQVLRQFDIHPQYDLNVMQASQTLAGLSARVIIGMDQTLEAAEPDLLLVHGDTTTSFTAALSAFYRKVPVGHVEAGLRSHDRYSPFPEELNRSLTARIAELHFAPTKENRRNLQKEGVIGEIFVTGNTVIDALRQMVSDRYEFPDPLLRRLSNSTNRLIVMTAHRRENLGEPLANICRAVRRLVETFPDIEIVYPVHPNPAVRTTVEPLLGDLSRVHLIDPIEVQDMHNLMHRSYLVLTDSGGLQEEAAALGKPVVVLRKETERTEICDAGKAVLAGTDEQAVFDHMAKLLQDSAAYATMKQAPNPYGDGQASHRIVESIAWWAGLTGARPADFEN